jgi:hypothetical protein
MMTVSRCLLSLVLTLGFAVPALADPPPEPTTCKIPAAKHMAIGRFQVTHGELNDFKMQHVFPARPPGARRHARTAYRRATLAELVAARAKAPGRSTQRDSLANGGVKKIYEWCGIVDNWHYAAMKAQDECDSLAGSTGTAYFKADSSYVEFNDADNHHALYSLDASKSQTASNIVLEGSCNICMNTRSTGTATAVPIDPIKVLDVQSPTKSTGVQAPAKDD